MDNLNHIVKNENNASYFINTPRIGHYTLRTCAKFIETYAKQENTRPMTERVSKEGDLVKVWLRGYSGYSYMIETPKDNLQDGVR